MEGKERNERGSKAQPLVAIVTVATPGVPGSPGRFSHAHLPQLCSPLLAVMPRSKKLQTSGLIVCHLLL